MKKRLLAFLLALVFTSVLGISNVSSEDKNLYLQYEIQYGDKNKGNIITENRTDEESKGIDSFALGGTKLFLLNSVGAKVLIYDKGIYKKSISIQDKYFLDIYSKDNLIYLYNADGNVYIYNEEGNLISKHFCGL